MVGWNTKRGEAVVTLDEIVKRLENAEREIVLLKNRVKAVESKQDDVVHHLRSTGGQMGSIKPRDRKEEDDN